MSLHVRKGDDVVILCGKDRGKRGKVLFIDTKKSRVKVEKCNLIKRHVRPSQKNPQGGIVEKEGTIHISNVALWDAKAGKPCRTRVRTLDDGRKVRVSTRTGETFGE